MVVLINYLHVMTILPSSILVDQIYVAPLQKDVIAWFKSKFFSKIVDHKRTGGKSLERNTSLDELDDAVVESCVEDQISKEKGSSKNNVDTSSDDLDRVDQYLVETYAPFVTRRSSYLIGFPIALVSPVGQTIIDFVL